MIQFTNTRSLIGWCWLAVVLALAGAGYESESRANTDFKPAEIFTLVSIDGKPVPCVLTRAGANMTVKSGVFTINSDGTCISKAILAITPFSDGNRVVKGTYKRKGTKLTMKWAGAGVTTGIVESNTFTINDEGMVFIYRK
jgi:hypothetical protein